jgi:hypothetical protein
MIQSAEVCDSCEYLTLEEKGQLASHGAKSGRKIGILFSLHLVIVACFSFTPSESFSFSWVKKDVTERPGRVT